MPAKKDGGGKETPAANVRDSRRNSIGRPQPKDQTSGQAGTRLLKRKLSIETDPNKKGKAASGAAMATSTSSSGNVEGDPVPPSALLADMHKRMVELSAQMGEVREDISGVKKDLGEQIKQGNLETAELRRRMD